MYYLKVYILVGFFFNLIIFYLMYYVWKFFYDNDFGIY